MDVIATLIEISAFNLTTGATVVGRLTDRNDPRATTANGQSWLPLLASAPSVGTSVFNGAFTGAGQIDLGDFTITLADALGDAFTGLVWDGADVKIYAGPIDTGPFPLIYRAVGESAQRKGRLELQVSLTTRASLLDVNILTQSYAGTGQLEGDAGLKGTVKPWALGNARFCKPVLVNAAKQIWQVSAYGPIQGTTNVFEGGQEITGFDGDKDLATMLGDAGPAQGKWWRNNQYGIFRLGSQPLYQITAHVKGDTNAVVGGTALTKLGDIVGRILALTSSITVKASSLATLNQSVTKPFDQYFDSQGRVSDAIIELLLSVGGYYTFDESGNLIFGLVRFGQAMLNLDGLNRVEPTVLGINQMPTSAPVWYLRLGAEQCHFVHDASNLPAVVVQQGADITKAQQTADAKNKTFPPSAQPPTGAIDGDQWPDTSVSPTTMRRYSVTSGTWIATSNQITTANQVPYANGQTVEALRPAEGNATVGARTGTNLIDQGGVTLSDSSIKNALVTIGANGQLAGAGGGQVTIGGLGYTGDTDAQRNSRVTVDGSGTIQGIGTANVVADNSKVTVTSGGYLANGYGTINIAIGNSLVSISAGGALSGAGGGQVTFSGLGGGPVGTLSTVDLAGSYASGTLPTNKAAVGLINANVSLGANGALSGGGGGQVTIVGLGYLGNLRATRNDDGANMVPAPLDTTTWVTFNNGVVFVDRGDNSRPIGRAAARFSADGGGAVYSAAAAIKNLTPGETIFVRHTIQTDGTIGSASDYIALIAIFYDAAGNSIGNTGIDQNVTPAGQVGSGVTKAFATIVPAGAATMALASRRTGSSGGYFYTGEPYVGRAQAGADVTVQQPVVSKLSPTNGRAIDTRLLNSSNAFGLRSLSQPPGFTASISGSSATISLDSSGVYYTDWQAQITLPSASFPGLALSTMYYFWRNMPVDGAGDSYGYSTDLTQALGTGKSYFGNYTTPNSGGGGGGGGYYGGDNCVWADAWVPTKNRGVIRARDVRVGDLLRVLAADPDKATWAPCTGNSLAMNDCCRLVGAYDAGLTLAINTPVTLCEDAWIVAANAWGRTVAHLLEVDDQPTWAPLPDVEGIGQLEVARISCSDGTYAAADRPEGPFIFTHNLRPQKP